MFLSSFDHVTILLFILQVTISAKSRLEHQLTSVTMKISGIVYVLNLKRLMSV